MFKTYLYSKRFLIVLHDIGMAMLAWVLSWWIRYNLDFPFPDLAVCLYSLPLIVIIQSLVYWRINLYRGIWRFASLPDLWNIFRAAFLGSMLIMIALFLLTRLEGVPRSILILYPAFLILLLGGPRLGYRIWKDRSLNLRGSADAKRILIIGAGRAGEMLARDMLRDERYIPVGFIDDNPALSRSEIHGIRVLGPLSNLATYVSRFLPEIIVIAVPSATDEEMQRMVELAEQTGLPVRTLPKINEMISDKASVKELRAVSIEDLLGREKVELDWTLMSRGITGKKVLVTGGGGSIGSELCRQIANLNPNALIIYERSEYNLYRILNDLSAYEGKFSIHGVLGDICDGMKLDKTFQKFSPELVYHAAAYKHVPILEKEVREAVKNNVLGTVNLANIAEKNLVEKFIFISTDKAVNPVNVLGATKRLGELYCLSKNTGKTRFCIVRFGNVLGSDGSVIQLFRKQIENGGPVTVTHSEISRYFMTIRESCLLILQSSIMGQGKEVFVLDMGKPVKILYLAEQMIRLSNSTGTKDIGIEIIGLRPGEKLSEELFYENEIMMETDHNKILLARHDDINPKMLMQTIKTLEQCCNSYQQEELLSVLKEYIPDIENVSNEKIIQLHRTK